MHKTMNAREEENIVPAAGKFTFYKLEWLEWIAVALSMWFLFHPRPYKLLFIALLILPVAGIVLNSLDGKQSIASLMRRNANVTSERRYYLANYIAIASLCLLIRVALDYKFDDLRTLLVPGIVASCLMIVLLFSTHHAIGRSTKDRWWIYIVTVFNMCMYGCAAAFGVNCVFDFSAPVKYETEVLGKKITNSRKLGNTYYLKVAPWAHHPDSEQLKVSPVKYQATAKGDCVTIDLKKGLLGIAWYDVAE